MASKIRAQIALKIYDNPEKHPEDADFVELLNYMEYLINPGNKGNSEQSSGKYFLANLVTKNIIAKYAKQELALLKKEYLRRSLEFVDEENIDYVRTKVQEFDRRASGQAQNEPDFEAQPEPSVRPQESFSPAENAKSQAAMSFEQPRKTQESTPEKMSADTDKKGQPGTERQASTPLFELANNIRRKRIQEDA
jgi:hypothetical protein